MLYTNNVMLMAIGVRSYAPIAMGESCVQVMSKEKRDDDSTVSSWCSLCQITYTISIGIWAMSSVMKVLATLLPMNAIA